LGLVGELQQIIRTELTLGACISVFVNIHAGIAEKKS